MHIFFLAITLCLGVFVLPGRQEGPKILWEVETEGSPSLLVGAFFLPYLGGAKSTKCWGVALYEYMMGDFDIVLYQLVRLNSKVLGSSPELFVVGMSKISDVYISRDPMSENQS